MFFKYFFLDSVLIARNVAKAWSGSDNDSDTRVYDTYNNKNRCRKAPKRFSPDIPKTLKNKVLKSATNQQLTLPVNMTLPIPPETSFFDSSQIASTVSTNI